MSEHDSDSFSPKLYAKRKVMDILARREHSEKELRTKLKDSFKRSYRARKKLREEAGDLDYESPEAQQAALVEEAINEAIEFAKANNWMSTPDIMAQKMADMLHRRKKGSKYIHHFLKEKGLPPVHVDRDQEYEKALELAQNKFSELWKLPFEARRKEQARLMRFLASRGYDSEVVMKVSKTLSTHPDK